MSRVIGIIPARYGSSRFPGKPLAKINGKTLIQRTYENAGRCSLIGDIYVATDDARIAEHVESFGARAIMTSPLCPTGTERVVEALKGMDLPEDAIILNIQGDTPLLETYIFEEVIEALRNNPLDVMATAACPIVNEEEAKDPNIVKCVLDKSLHAMYFSRSTIPYPAKETCRCFHHLGIYAYRYEFICHYATLSPTPLQKAEDLEQLKILEHGFRIKVALVKSSSFGVDRPEDIRKIQQYICQ